MPGWDAIVGAWELEPSVIIGCAALLAAYGGVAVRFRVGAHGAVFAAGVLVLALSLLSPIDVLADDYLFSAHMLQHLLMVLLVAPLLIVGLPPALVRALLARRALRSLEGVVAYPPLAFIIGMGDLALWHVPLLYNAALASEAMHIFEHITFLVSAVIYWWPVLKPVDERRMGLGAALIYLAAGGAANALIGVTLLVLPVGVYPAYLQPEDTLGILTTLREAWGITAARDQHYGALLMIVAGTPVFTAAFGYTLWLNRATRVPARATPI